MRRWNLTNEAGAITMKYKTTDECNDRFQAEFVINEKAAASAMNNVEDSMSESKLNFIESFNVYFDAGIINYSENN